MNFHPQNEELPYERFRKLGPAALSESELLAIILRSGTRKDNAYVIAKHVLECCCRVGDGLRGLYHLSLDELMQIPGIGFVKAVQLKALGEICNRMKSPKISEKQTFLDPQSIVAYFGSKVANEEVEYVFLMCLDNKGRLLQDKLMSVGSVRMSLIPPREIFIEALRQKAVHIVLVHNHPSGDPSPSISDKKATELIKQIGDLIDIPLLDHIIIGDRSYYSFRLESVFE